MMRTRIYSLCVLLLCTQLTTSVLYAMARGEVPLSANTQNASSNDEQNNASSRDASMARQDNSTDQANSSEVATHNLKAAQFQEVQSKLIFLANTFQIPNLGEVLSRCYSISMMEQVYAILMAYYPHTVQKVYWKHDDVVVVVNGIEIWYAGGRLLHTNNLAEKERYRRVLYPYRIEPIQEIFHEMPPPFEKFSQEYIRASDFQVAVLEGMPAQLEPYITEVRILGNRVRLHPLAAKQAILASEEVLQLAQEDTALARFIEELKTISGFVNRKVQNSSNISMHAFGIALDFIPYNYRGKFTYWQWAKALDSENWNKKLLDTRWLIPQKIVEVFESHGFVWGGKWPNYDTMHFEYRPELIAYAQTRKVTGSISEWRSALSTSEATKVNTVPNRQ